MDFSVSCASPTEGNGCSSSESSAALSAKPWFEEHIPSEQTCRGTYADVPPVFHRSSKSKKNYALQEEQRKRELSVSLVTHVRDFKLYVQRWSDSIDSILDMTMSDPSPNEADTALLCMSSGNPVRHTCFADPGGQEIEIRLPAESMFSVRSVAQSNELPATENFVVSSISESRHMPTTSRKKGEYEIFQKITAGAILDRRQSSAREHEGTQRLSVMDKCRHGVKTQAFEFLSAVVIFFNAVSITYSTDYAARNLEEPPSTVVSAMEVFFTYFYVVELVLRMSSSKASFFYGKDGRWNCFDCVLVIVALYDHIVNWLHSSSQMINPTFLRLVRMVRMAKLLRMLRVMRMFQELRLMISGIIGSMRSMLGALIMISIVTYMFGICFLQAATAYLMENHSEVDPLVKVEITKHWGSVEKAMMSLYVSGTNGDSWVNIAESLRPAGSVFFYLFLLYIAFFTFVIVNTLTSLFVESTLQNADKDRQVIVQAALSQRTSYIKSIEELFHNIDVDQSGELSFAEVLEKTEDPKMLAFAASLDIEVIDVAQFFGILSEYGHHKVDIETFVCGCMRMKGNARSTDLLGLIHYVHHTQAEQLELLEKFDESLLQIRESLLKFA